LVRTISSSCQYRATFFALVLTALATAQQPSSLETAKTLAAPHLSQTDPEGGFSGGGDMFCAPTAASNALVLLSRGKYPNLLPGKTSEHRRALDLIRTLAGPDYMGTNDENGTGPAEVLKGLTSYIEASGYKVADIRYEGWRYVPKKVRVDGFDKTPTLPVIQRFIRDPGGIALLNVGYYIRTPEGNLRRTGGHWITALGYGTDGTATDPNILLVHNPAIQTRGDLSSDVIHANPMERGDLTGKTKNLPQSAEGYFAISGPGFPKGRKWDVAVIDCVVLFTLKPASH
jgi:hypothetical protein